MKADDLRKKFIEFFVEKGHKEIPSASLVPTDDPTVLFTTAGMHPLIPYLMGQSHPLGKRLCSVQKCLRTDDIEEIGDMRHFTFFEMLGNWSLGDYFKKEAIEWSFEFLTDKKWLGLDPKRIYISVFEGDKDAPKDEESIKIWQETFKKVGIEAKVGDWKKPNLDKGERIFAYSKKENWWGPAGQTGPCGPDTEMFYDTGLPHDEKFGKVCHPNCDCGRFIELWNDVFMQYNKKTDGNFEPLSQKNVDTGFGLERGVAIMEFLAGKIKVPDPFQTELFEIVLKRLEENSQGKYQNYSKEFRIILDHLRATVFLISDGVEPSNKDRGYILRRLIRRSIDNTFKIGFNRNLSFLAGSFINIYKKTYPELLKSRNQIIDLIRQEDNKYGQLKKELKKIEIKLEDKIIVKEELKTKKRTVTVDARIVKRISGREAFNLYSTYGFSPAQLKAKGYIFDEKEFEQEKKKHQELSRAGAQQRFTGGLQDHSEQTTKLHTATHLLHEALRRVLGTHVQQVGSNITAERLRFDFTHPDKLTEEQIKKVEDLVNEQIKKNLKVECKIMTLIEAQKQGALAFFGQKYPEKVKVYSIPAFSLEVCGGPHVDFTGRIGKFRIKKEESCGAGKRRIYAVVEPT